MRRWLERFSRVEEATTLRRLSPLSALAALFLLGVGPALGQSLRGSEASVNRTHQKAHDHDFTFLTTSAQVRRFADAGYLVRVRPNLDYTLHEVSFPYARPEVATFIQRLGSQYRRACGEQLVVTSLTRPVTRQPRNASSLSVHPTGMAVDLRKSRSWTCRRWLESTLLHLEKAGVLEATRERTPSHYHVAVFPRQYGEYVAALLSGARSGDGVANSMRYTVRNGDSLWTIARRHDITVSRLRSANGIQGSRIFAGQVLTVPSR